MRTILTLALLALAFNFACAEEEIISGLNSTHIVKESQSNKTQNGTCTATDNDVICGTCTQIKYIWSNFIPPLTRRLLETDRNLSGKQKFTAECTACKDNAKLTAANVSFTYDNIAKQTITKIDVSGQCETASSGSGQSAGILGVLGSFWAFFLLLALFN